VKTTRPTRIAITSGAAVLCLGVAAPSVAYACTGGGTSSAARPASAAAQQFSAPTLQQEHAWIDSFVAHRTAWLDHLSAVVSADPELSADQQARALDSIAQAESALSDLQAAVDAATSTDQVHDIVKAALDSMPMPWWPHPTLRQHGFDHHAFDHLAFDHHARKAMRHVDRSRTVSPADVTLRSSDDHTRSVRYAGYLAEHKRFAHHDFGARHWSHRGDRFGQWGGHRDHWGGHDRHFGGHGDWGR
jgi:hypothetical protein